MSKPVVIIYVNPQSNNTKLLDQFLARHIDQINRYIYVKKINVTAENVQQIKKKGIDRTPTLVFNNKKYVNLENIIKILTPPNDSRDSFGFGNTGPDEQIHKYHEDMMLKVDDQEEDEDDPENRENVLKQKMAALQKKRQRMDEETASETKLTGGKHPKTSGLSKTEFKDDDEFRRATKVDQITETPVKKFMSEDDGDIILEDYYLEMANQGGKKVGKNVSRRR